MRDVRRVVSVPDTCDICPAAAESSMRGTQTSGQSSEIAEILEMRKKGIVDWLDQRQVAERKRKQAEARALAARRKAERKAARSHGVDYGIRGVPNELRKTLALPGYQVMCARMRPGVWYTSPQIKALLPEYAAGSARAWLWSKAPELGLVERAGNPERTGERAWPAKTEARYVYALTEKGAAEAAEWRCELGMGSDTRDG